MDIFLVISNLLFVPAAVVFAILHHSTRVVHCISILLASSFHHSCDSWRGGCVASPNLLRKTDFFFAQLMIPSIALYLIFFPKRYAYLERYILAAFAGVIFVTELYSDEPFYLQLIIAGTSAGMVIGYWIWYATRPSANNPKKMRCRLPPYNWNYLSVGIVLIGFASVLFATQAGWHNGYWHVHSMWHCLGPIGIIHIALSRKAASVNAAVDSKVMMK